MSQQIVLDAEKILTDYYGGNDSGNAAIEYHQSIVKIYKTLCNDADPAALAAILVFPIVHEFPFPTGPAQQKSEAALNLIEETMPALTNELLCVFDDCEIYESAEELTNFFADLPEDYATTTAAYILSVYIAEYRFLNQLGIDAPIEQLTAPKALHAHRHVAPAVEYLEEQGWHPDLLAEVGKIHSEIKKALDKSPRLIDGTAATTSPPCGNLRLVK